MAFPVVKVCVTVVGLVQSSFLCAGSAVIVVIYACVVTCGQSFTMLSGWGILISFWSISVFSPTLLSLLLLLPYYYCHYCCYYYWLLLLLLFPQSSWGWVWWAELVAGLWVGQAFGVLMLPGFGVSSSSSQVPGHPTSICDTGVKFIFKLQ